MQKEIIVGKVMEKLSGMKYRDISSKKEIEKALEFLNEALKKMQSQADENIYTRNIEQIKKQLEAIKNMKTIKPS